MAEKEYIERGAVTTLFARACIECKEACETFDGFDPDCNQCLLQGVIKSITSIPAADVRPVVRAYWKSVPHKRARVCSRCEADEPYKFADDDANIYNFCPNCGAMMEEN